jgi:2,3,4,5-tetrahydropyridine-2,6-dicarboxylate N-succinyltransferase
MIIFILGGPINNNGECTMSEKLALNGQNIIELLENGTVRAAQKVNGVWHAQADVKAAIVEAFKIGVLAKVPGGVDKANVLPREFDLHHKVRVVPGGTNIRRGAYIAEGVVVLAPSFINVGAYVDTGTMVDSHALVGSCAQIGKRVHLSASVMIGGVLEPIGQRPVIVEDDAFIGAGSVLVEGIIVGERAVIAPGVTLSRSVPIYDIVNHRQLGVDEMIPAGAIVVPGTRPIKGDRPWAHEMGLQLSCALIIKYRDEKSDASLVLEQALR